MVFRGRINGRKKFWGPEQGGTFKTAQGRLRSVIINMSIGWLARGNVGEEKEGGKKSRLRAQIKHRALEINGADRTDGRRGEVKSGKPHRRPAYLPLNPNSRG